MEFIDWAATILGAMLIFAGVRAIRRREAHVPDRCAVARLAMEVLDRLCACAVILDIAPLQSLFRLFPKPPIDRLCIVFP